MTTVGWDGPTTSNRVIGGRYALLAELGRGGMGVVWRAEDRVMGRQVAVKELHLAEGLRPEERRQMRERLLREARTAGRLKDPGIVTVYDVVTDNGLDHIVMELIEARTLADAVAVHGPLDEATAVSVARQLLSALDVAHRAGVLHRDVKPGNVMLGPDGRIKLTDFGIAQATDDTRLTGTGLLLGSPGYLSPEQLDGADASPASDLWAVGATLYYAVEGRSAFTRETTAATISAVLRAEIPPARIGGPLGSVIAGLLQRDPRVRLSGAQAAAILGSTATRAHPHPLAGGPTTPLPGGPAAPARERWPLLVAGLVLGLVLGGAAGFAATRFATAPPGPEYTVLTYGLGGDMPEFSPSFGYCFLGQPGRGRSVDSGASRSCDATHDSQVFGVFGTYSSSTEVAYPGQESLTEAGTAFCRIYYDAIVVGDDKADLTLTLLIPSQTAFGNDTRSPTSTTPSFQDRDLYCVLSAPQGAQLEGSRLAEQYNG